ncbi:hypothetical protein AX769_18410 [Frondihabitans sp. PAMC 28766]|uniref:GNAT family N-acetyltransferase n=1 Tax=Frondihabitans sp. PAMC 28766 TaxID=1795630 RepID=UPI00078EA0E0|nr:GNAT family N-acetyltransferase [Frondihabitans sp. PAMC 28766]AMM21759.1 hypothetical protein AX769_18410 [Frondihabitans sp. PAMC 28766]
MKPFALESDRLRLEAPRTADIGAIYDACQDAEVQKYTTVPVPYTFQDAQFFVSQVVERVGRRAASTPGGSACPEPACWSASSASA